ncbi:MAG: SHIRT domain-containing protein, partial [Lachnospiraceae bacterium]|nr:SHIRT domain-containing protein [Lachnospiraceae bacterium]
MKKKRISLTLGALGAAAIIGSTGTSVFADDKVYEKNINYVSDNIVDDYSEKEAEIVNHYKTIDESRALYESVKSELMSVTDEYDLISPYVKSTDKRTMTDEQIREKYTQTYNLTGSFNAIRENLDNIMPKVIQNSPDKYSSSYIISNKKQIIRGLTYLYRYYNFPVGNSTAFDMLLFNMKEINGQNGDALKLLIDVGNYSSVNLLGYKTSEVYKSIIGKITGFSTLPDFIEKMAELDGCSSGKEFLIKRSKAIFSESGNTGDIFEKSKKSESISALLLPLLTLSESSIYVMSTDNTTTVGLTSTYGDVNTVKSLADKTVTEQQAFLNALKRISGRGDSVDSYPDVLVIDTLASKTKPGQSKQQTWSPEYGQGTDSGVAELISPGYLYSAYSRVGAQASKNSNGSIIRYFIDEVLNDDGVSVYTHELTHVFDKSVWIGAGRRAGSGSETYARGLFESINNTQTPNEPYGPVFSLNTAYELGDDRIQNKSPERFQSSGDVSEYMKGLMNVVNALDVIEAQEILKLTDADKAVLFNRISLDGDKVTFSNITAEEASRLHTVEDLVDNNIVSGRLVPSGNSTIGTLSNGYNGEYYVVPMFEGIYGAAVNNNGFTSEFLFRRYAWELMGEVGWNEGFIPWISDKYATDADAVQNIVGSDYASFKKKIYKESASNLVNLKKTAHYNDYDAIRRDIAEALQDDLAAMKQEVNKGTYSSRIHSVRNAKMLIFQDYLLETNDFRESIYKNNAPDPKPEEPKVNWYTVNYEWENAPVTEEIPESGKTYEDYDGAVGGKDTKYTSSYETVVDDKVYRFSGWTENVSDTTITYTGTWTATDIIDFSKAGIQVYPVSTTYTGYRAVPTITVTYNGNVVNPSDYTVTYLNYKGETVSPDGLIHAGDYTIVISPKAGEKYNRGTGRADFVITKKTSTSAPRFASYEKGSFSPDNNGSFTYNAPVKSGCEYKLDNGTWQDSNTFYNVQKGSSHTVYIRYKGTSDVTESNPTTITVTAPSDASLMKLEEDGFRAVNDLNAGDYYNIETVARKDGFVDISGASQQNNANVDLWSNNGNPCQKFYF